ncbi:hypothetical protein [Nitrosomonas sp. Is79A3]|uniref:hypothetical protein n=1 Tax=Nitrosomonas sp. (strain Is79A3) TaxID=261292 RepID=UPI0012EA8230
MQQMHVFCVAHTVFNQTDITRAAVFDSGQWQAVKFHVSGQTDQGFIPSQKRHVAAKTSR